LLSNATCTDRYSTAQILIHESGHALVLMRYGIPFQPMVFIPFMGAYVAHAGTLSAWRSAMVALAGPAAVGLYKLNAVVTHSLKAPGFNT
jgi:Zn-dependent protease